MYLQNEQVRENLKYARNHHKRYKYRKYSKLNTTNLLAIFSNGNCTTATHFKLFQFLRITFVLFILDVKCQTIPVYRTTSFYSKVTFTKPICLFLFLFFVCIVFQLFEWWQHGIQFEDLGNFENLMWRLNVYTERKWNKNPSINYIDKIHL